MAGILLNRLQRLIGQSQPLVENTHWISGRKQILRILNRILEERCLLQAKIADHPGVFTTAVIGINPKTGIMALDEITPAEGHELFLEHKAIHLRGRSHGVEIEFTPQFISERRHNGIAYYQTGIPQGLIYIQRRDDHRVPLTGAPLFRGHRGAQNQQLLNGYAADLSLHGIGVVLKDLETIHRGDEMTTCVLQMPGQERFFFSLEVRFAQQIQMRGTTRIGGRFIDLGKRESQRLAKIVRELERSHAKLGIE